MRLKTFAIAVLLASIAGLVACAPNRVVTPTPFSQLDEQARPYPRQEYIIAPGDVLDIRFANNPEINEPTMSVRPDGRISLQMAPEVMAAGLTPVQLRDVLLQKYSSEILKPDIVVIVKSFSFPKVLVDGEVVGPGIIEMRGPMTVMRAISQARGTKDTARLSNVIIIRKDGEGNPAGTMIDLRKVIDGTDFSQDIRLMPYDIVYVPKSNIARVGLFIQQYINGAVPFAAFSPFLYYYSIQHSGN